MRRRTDGKGKGPARTVAWTGGLAVLMAATTMGSPTPATALERPGGAIEIKPIMLPAPPFGQFVAPTSVPRPAPATRLSKASERRNAITDVERWFATNQLRWPAVEAYQLPPGSRRGLPPEIPLQHAGLRLWRAVSEPPLLLLIYGGRYLVGYETAMRRVRFAYDFVRYMTPPAFAPADRELVEQRVEWAGTGPGVLYVSNFHRTYARSSLGRNAYVTAIEIATQRLLWRSRPLVANANNFLVAGGVIVTGYGFTAEPDYLYVLDKHTGRVVQTTAVRSGPEYLVPKGDRLYVRTYDTDYVFVLAVP